MEILKDVLAGAPGGVLTVAIVGGCLWLLRESILSALARSVNRDTERYKHELSTDSERYKHELSTDSERFKHELGGLNEHLKYDLQKETLKAALMTPKKLETYSAVIEAMRKAEGAAGRITMRFGRDYKLYDEKDLEELIEGLPITHGEKRRLLGVLERDRKEGIRELEKLEQQVVFLEAKNAIQEARNLLILSRLHLSPSVRQKAGEILQVYGKLAPAYEHRGDIIKANDEFERQEVVLFALEEEMQAELLPMERPKPAT